MKLLVVILNYRATGLTVDCLGSLASRISAVPGTRVAVCENGTGEEAAQQLRQVIDANGWRDWVDLTAVHPNRGFTGGNNLIIRRAMGSRDPPDYFLLLNADTIVLDGALEGLVALMDHQPKVGIAGSQLLTIDGRVGPSPYRFASLASEFAKGMNLGFVSRALSRWIEWPPTPTKACRVDWLCGASMLLRRTMLEEIGLLDEGLYTYFDDVDLCLRARRAGWQTWYVPESRVIHLEGGSTGISGRIHKRRPQYWFQARRRFFLKHYGPLRTALVDAAFISGFAMWRVRRRLQGKPDSDPPDMLSDFIRNSVLRTGFRLTEVENPAMKDFERDSGGN